MPKPTRLLCDLCARLIPPHAHYILKMQIYADPQMPPVSSQELAEMDLDAELQKLIEQMKNETAEDLMDQVHRSFEFRLCRVCQMKFLANPLGKPREPKPSSN
jgi:hypothetical protein